MYPYCIWDELSLQEKKEILTRSYPDMGNQREAIASIIEEVRETGEKALRKYSAEFDHCNLADLPLRVSEQEIARAKDKLPENIVKALDLCIAHVKQVCAHTEIPSPQHISPAEGIQITHSYHPISSVGLYVPRGRGSFPSMVYMQGIPAQTAKVPRIVMVTPPEPDGSINPACLYAASESGIQEIYRVGGAHAIALLAFGTDHIPPVAKILGPGSIYVSIAKQIVSSLVEVGTVTGPSESMIIADQHASAQTVLSDLLTEAEHGSDSTSILLTPSVELARSVCKKLKSSISHTPSPRKEFLLSVFSLKKRVIVTRDREQSIEIAESFAPEHLQLNVADPHEWHTKIHHAGEILIGRFTPFSIANYATGANAVLPTGGFAKTASALSVFDYLRTCSRVEVSPTGYAALRNPVRELAKYEGFYHHAEALTQKRT